MLLLINRHYPALGAVLGVIAAVTSIAIGVATTRSMFVVMGVISIVLSVARITHQRRSVTPEPRQ
jgi:hypothetical protein